MNCLSAKFFANQSSEPLHTIRIEKEHSASLSGTIVNFQKDVNQYLTSIIEKTGKQSTVASSSTLEEEEESDNSEEDENNAERPNKIQKMC